MRSVNTRRQNRRTGAMLILIGLCIPIVLIFAAYSINIAWMQLTRTELRTATDAAARAGSRTLSLTQTAAAARTAAIDAAGRNTVGGKPLALRDTDVQIGKSSEGTTGKWTFMDIDENSSELNSVRVTGSRASDSASGAIPMLFSGFLDRTHFEPVKVATASQLDRDVMLALDRSGSMRSRTRTGNRIGDLQDAVEAFLNALLQTPQDELVGIVSYSSNSRIDQNLSISYNELMSTVNGLRPSGLTAIGRGLNSGITGILDTRFSRATAAKTIVVMTDGHHNRGVGPVEVARTAYQTYGITVHTITFSRGANQTHMRKVAAAGGGSHWHANDHDELVHVFEEVANNLPTLLTE